MPKLDQRGSAEKAAVTAHSTGTGTKIGEVEREEKRTEESKDWAEGGGTRRPTCTSSALLRVYKY